MKRILCIILTLVCVFAFNSCQLLDYFISSERVEATDLENSKVNSPDRENNETTDEKTDVTIPDDKHEQDTPDEPSKDANNNGIPDDKENLDGTTTQEEAVTTPAVPTEETTTTAKEPEETTHIEDTPVTPDDGTITVQITWQSGGVHAVSDTIMVSTPATLSHIYNLFVQRYYYDTAMRGNVTCMLNGKPIDPTYTTYMNDGDVIYLEENWQGYHLHFWDNGHCMECYEECSHGEWVELEKGIYQCFYCKGECIHETWQDGQCNQCGKVCTHEQWDDSRQCILCGFWMGVDMIEITIQENGEYYSYTQSIGVTVHDLVMAYFGYLPWEALESTYEFYYNDVRVDGSFWIAESGVLNLVAR